MIYVYDLVMANKLERILGQGGFGMVYHGYTNDTEEMAVKYVLLPSSVQRQQII